MWFFIGFLLLCILAFYCLGPWLPVEENVTDVLAVVITIATILMVQYMYVVIPHWLFCSIVVYIYCNTSMNTKFNNVWQKVQHLWQDFGEYSEVYDSQNLSSSQQMMATSPPVGQPVFLTQPTNYMAYSAGLAPAPGQDALPAEAWYAERKDLSGPKVTSTPLIRPAMDNLRRPVLANYAKYRQDMDLTVNTPLAPPRRLSPQRPVTNMPEPPRFGSLDFRKRKSSASPDLMPRMVSYMGPERFSQPVYQQTQQQSGAAVIKQDSFKTRLMSVLTSGSKRTVPPGLLNNGQNICFMNSVLQCLAHTPDLINGLMYVSQTNPDISPLVSSLAEVLHGLNVKPGSYREAVVDTSHFRQVASSCPASMVSGPGAIQHQQDAGEFLTWLLQYTHSGLNQSSQSQSSVNIHHNHPLKTLKFIYGDLSEQHIEELKTQCRQEIERASMTDGMNYAEPLQRLADLEWLSYKDKNRSIVDDLFTGMRMEAQQCLSCSRISVFPQPFNVLTVPLVEPSRETGLAYIQQCFDKFGVIEELYGSDGLQCSCATRNYLAVTPAPLAKHKVFIKDIGISPILGNGHVASTPVAPLTPVTSLAQNDISFAENMRTSTPIQETSSKKRTCGKRRSLLRQLPHCLIVQLMRFSFKDGQLYKDCRPVQVDPRDLDLGHLVIDSIMQREDLASLNESHHYQLYGVCLHLGGQTSNSGHYIAYTRAIDGRWYKYDDELVSHVNMEYELNTLTVRENAYLLFYRKKERNPMKMLV